jgi:hypothetical protein
MEGPRAAVPEKFKSPQEELAFLREQVRQREAELGMENNPADRDRVASKELALYAETPPPAILHEEVILPEHDIIHHVLKLEPETHDSQIDAVMTRSSLQNKNLASSHSE